MAYKAVSGLEEIKARLARGHYQGFNRASTGIKLTKGLKPAEMQEALRLAEEHFASNPTPAPKKEKATKGKKVPSVATSPTMPPALPPKVIPLSELDMAKLNQDGMSDGQFQRVHELVEVNNRLLDGMLKVKSADPTADISDVQSVQGNLEKLSRILQQYEDYTLPIISSSIPKARTPVNAGVQQPPIPTKESESLSAPTSERSAVVHAAPPGNIPAAFMKPPTETERKAFSSTMPPPRN